MQRKPRGSGWAGAAARPTAAGQPGAVPPGACTAVSPHLGPPLCPGSQLKPQGAHQASLQPGGYSRCAAGSPQGAAALHGPIGRTTAAVAAADALQSKPGLAHEDGMGRHMERPHMAPPCASALCLRRDHHMRSRRTAHSVNSGSRTEVGRGLQRLCRRAFQPAQLTPSSRDHRWRTPQVLPKADSEREQQSPASQPGPPASSTDHSIAASAALSVAWQVRSLARRAPAFQVLAALPEVGP